MPAVDVATSYAVWGMSVVFVKHPFLRGLYLKTHPCVIGVPCPLKATEGCGAKIGEPCRNIRGEPKSETHYKRRQAYAKKLGRRVR